MGLNMGIFNRKDRDEEYSEYLNDRPMIGSKMDREEFNRFKNHAEEIADGTVMGTFERDEKVWDEVRKIKERKGDN